MDDISKIIFAFFGGMITIALVSVVVSRKSQAPQAIQAVSSAIGNIVAAAVNPVSANFGYGSGSQAATTPPSIPVTDSSVIGFAQSIVPGGSK